LDFWRNYFQTCSKASVRRVPQREEEEADPGQRWLLEFGADAKDPDKVEEKVKSII
jgi:hypothetical protein